MMTESLTLQLAPKVGSAVKELFELASKNQTHPGDLILFCENGHYWGDMPDNWSPYMVGPGFEGLAGFDRIDFFKAYISLPFEKAINDAETTERKLELRKQSIHLELMIYTHFWEATQNLKALKQLANLVDSKLYDWNIVLPEFERYKFIKTQIREVFERHNLQIANIIKDAYHSQIRNAFAHCQYSFGGTTIQFANYDPAEPWKVESLSFDDWERKFTMSALLYDRILTERLNLKEHFAQRHAEVIVRVPLRAGGTQERALVWHDPGKRFVWKQ
jgi:hypothetical protein